MNVIARKILLTFAALHPKAGDPLTLWYAHACKADWGSFADIRRDYSSADWVEGEGYIIFNIGGNKYRLIVTARFESRTIWIKEVLTHQQYDAWRP